MLWIFFLLLHTFLSIINCLTPEVETKSGKIIGKKIFYKDIPLYTFQSIPYAEPPIGEYRFKKPFPVKPWKRPLQATELPPGCVSYMYLPFLQVQSEDCLYLNIWTPSDSSVVNKKAVMFFIHPGYLTIGSSSLHFYDGKFITALGDVVLVSINYRLGPMGFLYAGTENAPGNMGLYDMLEALKWVKSNIRYFGGDENNLTLFGESSGGIAITMFMTSPLVQGYFHQGIIQSGTAVNFNGEKNDRDYINSQKLAEAVGCSNDSISMANAPDDVVQCLKGIDARKLCNMIEEISADPHRSIYPRYGDEILPNKTRLSMSAGNFTNINILIGVTSNEGSMQLTTSRPDVFGYFGHKYPHINRTFGEALIREILYKFPGTDAIIEHYLGDVSEYDYDTVLRQVEAAIGDTEIICPSVYVAEKVAEKGNNVYFYSFEHRSSVSPWASWAGVVHFDEVPILFGGPLKTLTLYGKEERKLSETMIKIWTNFAKTGHPDLEAWPLYSGKKHYYRVLLPNVKKIGIGPRLEQCNFLKKYYGF